MPGFTVAPSPPGFVDTGQGASGRLASWMAWGADPNPLSGPWSTVILRQEGNGALVDGDVPVALGTGGCGTWSPILDGSSNGATSGGDNAFFNNDETPVPEGTPITDDSGNVITDDSGNVFSSP